MKNRDLIELLQRHDPDVETGVESATVDYFYGRKRLLLLQVRPTSSPPLREWDLGGGRLKDNKLVHR